VVSVFRTREDQGERLGVSLTDPDRRLVVDVESLFSLAYGHSTDVRIRAATADIVPAPTGVDVHALLGATASVGLAIAPIFVSVSSSFRAGHKGRAIVAPVVGRASCLAPHACVS